MLRQVSKRNPNRCFVMSLPFVHSLWPAFAAQAAVVCIFKKQTLAADTPVQMQALRLRTPAHGSGWKIPSTSLCAPNTHNMFMISSISWRGFFHIPPQWADHLWLLCFIASRQQKLSVRYVTKNAMYSKIQRHDVGKDMKRLSRGFKDSGCFHFCRNWCWL